MLDFLQHFLAFSVVQGLALIICRHSSGLESGFGVERLHLRWVSVLLPSCFWAGRSEHWPAV